jgi:hypothetical protein
MFENPRYRARRPVEPPAKVAVNLSILLPGERVRWGIATPLWVRRAGIRTDLPVQGELSAWILTCKGDWSAVVRARVPVDGDVLELDMLVPAKAVKQAEG